MKIAVDFLVLPLLLSFAAAFTCPATTGRRSTVNSWSLDSAVAPTSTSAIAEDEETWYRAIQLADSRTTNVEECERLAAQLESVEDCQYEAKDSDTCDTEVSDRQELANILRLKVELKQRYVLQSILYLVVVSI